MGIKWEREEQARTYEHKLETKISIVLMTSSSLILLMWVSYKSKGPSSQNKDTHQAQECEKLKDLGKVAWWVAWLLPHTLEGSQRISENGCELQNGCCFPSAFQFFFNIFLKDCIYLFMRYTQREREIEAET